LDATIPPELREYLDPGAAERMTDPPRGFSAAQTVPVVVLEVGGGGNSAAAASRRPRLAPE
jgi:hypothetical protein